MFPCVYIYIKTELSKNIIKVGLAFSQMEDQGSSSSNGGTKRTWKRTKVSKKLQKLVEQHNAIQASQIRYIKMASDAVCLKFDFNINLDKDSMDELLHDDVVAKPPDDMCGGIATSSSLTRRSSSTTCRSAAGGVNNPSKSDLFASVLQACAASGSFWSVLGHVKYVSMLACVNTGTRNILQPTERDLPFWGVWCNSIRKKHTWKEMNVLMNLKRNDTGELSEYASKSLHNAENEDENEDELYVTASAAVAEKKQKGKGKGKQRAKTWSLKDVWNYMVNVKYDGSIPDYAASLKRYRGFQKIHAKRQIAFATKIMKEMEEEKAKVAMERAAWKKKFDMLQDEVQRIYDEDVQTLRNEFSNSICADGGLPSRLFTNSHCCDEEEEEEKQEGSDQECCMEISSRRWNIMVHISESLSLFMSDTLCCRKRGDIMKKDPDFTKIMCMFDFCVTDDMKTACKLVESTSVRKLLSKNNISIQCGTLRNVMMSCDTPQDMNVNVIQKLQGYTPLEERISAIKKISMDICLKLHVWSTTKAMTILLKTLRHKLQRPDDSNNNNTHVTDQDICKLVFSDRDRYQRLMVTITNTILNKHYYKKKDQDDQSVGHGSAHSSHSSSLPSYDGTPPSWYGVDNHFNTDGYFVMLQSKFRDISTSFSDGKLG